MLRCGSKVWGQDSLVEPEDDGSGDGDSGHEGVGAPIVACVDTPPVFEFAKHVFDFMALPVELPVEASGQYSSLSWRDAGPDAFGFQSSAIVVAVIAFITDHAGRVARKCWISELSTDMVVHLAFGEAQDQRPTIPITYGMEL